MIKNEELIKTMSPEQRIRLITSTDLYKSRTLEGYQFPKIILSSDPMRARGVRATDFPSDATLAAAWNPALVKRIYKCIGNEAKATVPEAYFTVSDDQAASISSEIFAYGRLLASKVQGLHASGAFVNYEDVAQKDDMPAEKTVTKLLTDAVLGEAQPDSLLCKDSRAAADYARPYRFGGLLCGVASTKEEVARFLNEGYSFIYLASDFTDELIPYLLDLTEEYKKASEACARGKLTPEKLTFCCDALEMLDMQRIDIACDNIIETLISLKNNGPDSVLEHRVSLASGGTAAFDEPMHDGLALEAARQSVVLLKNNGLLPLKHELSVAVIGEYAKNPAYVDTGNTATVAGLPFEIINDYEIKTAGFAYGYRRGEPGRADLVNTATRLCAQADVALVYLCAEKDAQVLPPEQLQLLEALYAKGVKIVAVVAADGVIDASFESMCSALLFTGRGGQRVANAVFEIITGDQNPSGRLIRPFPTAMDEATATVRYPFGYGLSYTTYEYTHLKITDRGVTCTVTNTGGCDGYATVQLYVRKKPGENEIGVEKQLRGFEKVFVRKNDSVKVEIRFGAETFRTFDEVKNKFVVQGGAYEIYLGEHAENMKLQGEVMLAPYVFDDERITNEVLDRPSDGRAIDKFGDTADKRAFYARKRGTSLGLRLTLALLLAVYADAVAAFLIIKGVIPDKLPYYLVIGGIALVVTVGVLLYVAVQVKRHNKQKTAEPTKLLGDVVAQVGEFDTLATVSYDTPILPETVEEAEQEEEAEAEAEPEVIRTYDTGFTEGEQEEIEFRENVSFNELCVNFHDYALAWGVEVEASSIRALFAALAAGKMILADAKNKEVLPDFLSALCGYFQESGYVRAEENWQSPADLLWTLDGDRYVASAFVNAVYSASRTPDKNAIAVIDNVRPSTLRDYFGDFIRYALYPSEEHVWSLTEAATLVLPHNIRYILITEDGWAAGLPAEIAAASVQIELIFSRAAAAGEPVEIKPVSYTAFEDMVREARETQFLSETLWKKWDEMVEAISANERFSIGNKSVLQLERLTAVALDCGADESEAFGLAFTGKIVGLLRTLKTYKQDGGEKTLFGIIEKLFAEEDLSRIQRALSKAAFAE